MSSASTHSPPLANLLLDAQGLQLRRDERLLLDNVALQLQAGELCGIIGPNGAGKSTLLRVLAGITPPDAGTVTLQGHPLSTLAHAQRARLLGYLEQRPRLHWPLSVENLVALGRLPHGDSGGNEAGTNAIDTALARTDTTTLRARAFHTLSEGEKLRVNLARVLAGQPALLLADEPVADLDPYYQLHTMSLLQEIAAQGTGALVVLHDLALAARFCARLVLLVEGRVLAAGSPRAVLTPALLAQAYRIEGELCFESLTLRVQGVLE